MNKPKLSVTIITINEERDLPKALESVKRIADEVIVVDSGSTDKTVEIAKKFGAKVTYRKFDNFASQKNFAVSLAKNDWIFSLDGDEVVSPELAREIEVAILDSKYNGFSIPRKNIILGKFIRYTRWQPELDRHIWLFRKSKGKWVGKIHEEVKIEGETGKLKSAKIHNHYEKVSDFWKMVQDYSTKEAESRIAGGTKFNLLRLLVDPPYNFLVRYVYRLGFLDGWRGFVLSILMAIYHILLWVKIWQRSK